MKTKKSKFTIGLIVFILIAFLTPFVVSAYTRNRQVSGSGRKTFSNSTVMTGWSGLLTHTPFIFQNDQMTFTGLSYSRWLGSSPWNADSITHYDVMEINGIGSVSFSGGIGASASGPAASFDIGGTTASNTRSYAYKVDSRRQVSVDYSYFAQIGLMTWMDLYTAACFQFGTNFIVVNSRVDNPLISRGGIYYT